MKGSDMKSVGIILTGIISLVLSSRMTLSIAYGATQKTEPRYYDGPCTSAEYTLCKLSEKILSKQAHEVLAEKVRSLVGPKTVEKPQQTAKHVSGRKKTQDSWKMYMTAFRPTGVSAMPAEIHHLEKPVKANKLARELLEKAPPALKVIAVCESGLNHYNPRTGYVLQGRTTPEDIGLLMVRSVVHEKTAIEDGYNIYSIYGNIGYAIKLYIEEGTKPWNSSKKCWGPKVPHRLRLPLKDQMPV